jgi:hypothetical protein
MTERDKAASLFPKVSVAAIYSLFAVSPGNGDI